MQNVEIQNVIGSTLKKAPSQDYIESFKQLIRGGFIKVSADNSLVLSTTALRSMEKLMGKISGHFVNYQPMKIYSSNQLEIAFEYLNSEIKSYRQLPSKSRFINFKTNQTYYLKQGLLYPNVSETLNFLTIEDSNNKEEGVSKNLKRIIHDIFESIDINVSEFDTFSPFNQFSGSSESKELAILLDEGKEEYVICNKCDYYSRKEIATFHKESKIEDELKDIIEVSTPGTNTITSLAELLNIDESRCAKVVFYCYKIKNRSKVVIVIVRGDMEVSEYKLKQLLKTDDLQFANDSEISSIKAVGGYASAIGINRDKCTVIVDDIVPNSTNLAAGANKQDFHYLNTNYGRDYEADIVGDVTLLQQDEKCKECQSKFIIKNGIPLFYSTLINNSEIIDFLDNKGKPQKTDIIISCFDITRIFGTLARVVDKFGVMLPHDLSPFQFVLITIGNTVEVNELSTTLYSDLKDKYDLLFDNRNVKVGVKLADADLRSIPYRLIISENTLENNEIEFSIRGSKDRNYFKIESVGRELKTFIKNN